MASKMTVFLGMGLLLAATLMCADAAGCEANGKTYAVGETWGTRGTDSYQPCAKLTCRGDDLITGVPCGVQAIPPGSRCRKVPGDRTAAYPGCCETVQCD